MKVIVIHPGEKWDCLAESVIEGLYENNIDIYASDSGNGVKRPDIYTDSEIIMHSKDCDYVFVIWGKIRDRFPGPKYYLLKDISMKEKIVYIDGSEWTATGHQMPAQAQKSLVDPSLRRGEPWINAEMQSKSSWYFKRECYPEDTRNGIIPLPLASTKNQYSGENYESDSAEKEIDVFCSFGNLGTGLRSEVYEFCKSLSERGYVVETGKGFDFKTFKEKIAKSYISIDSWGGGETCQRFWTNVANKTCCFSQKYTIDFPNSFSDGENFVSYDSIHEFKEKIIFYLENKEKCIEIGEKGYEHCKKYHTSKKQAQYIFKKLGEEL